MSDSHKNKSPNFFFNYLLPFIIIFILLSLWTHYRCCNKHQDGEHQHGDKHLLNSKHEDTNANKAITAPFVVSFADVAGMPKFKPSKNFGFGLNDFQHVQPVDKVLLGNLELLKKHMSDNPNKRLTVTGKYLSSEEYTGSFPNLGFARANEIKQFLINKGFNTEQIDLSGLLDDEVSPDDNNILFSVSDFSVKTLDTSALKQEKETLKTLKKTINVEPLVLNFKSNQAKIDLTEAQRNKVLDIVTYVGKTPNAIVQVVGHTDSSGDEDANKKLGLQRAQLAAHYLQDNGLNADDMHVSSMGEVQPVADNNTEAGKAKNRRTEVSVR